MQSDRMHSLRGKKNHCIDVRLLNLLTKYCSFLCSHVEILIEAKASGIWSLCHNWWSQHLVCSALDDFSRAPIAMICSSSAVLSLQGSEIPLPDEHKSLCALGSVLWLTCNIPEWEGQSGPEVGRVSICPYWWVQALLIGQYSYWVFSRSLQGLVHLFSFLSHWIMYIFGKIFVFPVGKVEFFLRYFTLLQLNCCSLTANSTELGLREWAKWEGGWWRRKWCCLKDAWQLHSIIF